MALPQKASSPSPADDATSQARTATLSWSDTGQDSDTKLLLHFEGEHGATVTEDHSLSEHAITLGAGAKIDAYESKWGDCSLVFDGTNDYLSTPDSSDWDLFSSTSSNWTIDLFVKHDNHLGYEGYVTQYQNAGNHWCFYHQHGLGLVFRLAKANYWKIIMYGGEITDTAWHHVALIKVGTDYGLYLDGNQVAYKSSSYVTTYSGGLSAGRVFLTYSWFYFDGHMDELRIRNGNPFSAAPVAAKTDTITVPTAAYDDHATGYDVYFGTDSTPDAGEKRTTKQTGLTYNPGTLDENATYYWRIDSHNIDGTTLGDVWDFTVGTKPAGTPVDTLYEKRLCAIANDKFWYETNPGVMASLTVGVDTTKQMAMWEGFQKVFVANASVLKVVDFINTKIVLCTAGALTTVPLSGEILTQAGSGASIVVDFINSAKTTIYGYETTGANFDITNAITAVDGQTIITGVIAEVADFVNGMLTVSALGTAPNNADTYTQANTDAVICVDFVNPAKTNVYGTIYGSFDTTNVMSASGAADDGVIPTAVRNVGDPQFYDWTVYPTHVTDSTTVDPVTYGSMPNEPKMGCLYRGRCILAGDKRYPHNWWMSRQGDPYDWEYAADDAQAPVAGNDADAGEVGDIITALIPYRDDCLIIGGAHSVWVLRGDPAAGGSLDNISYVANVFGQTSWCWGNKSDLYVVGTDALYRVPYPFVNVEDLTSTRIPNFIADWSLDPEVHRVTMGYDQERHGLVICRTNLDDNTTSSYWFDLRTEGFFPESYPANAGFYSQHYYTADNPDYKDLMIGCADGNILTFDNDTKNDYAGYNEQIISSYAVIGPQALSENEDRWGRINTLAITRAGAASGSEVSDTDSVDYQLFVDDTAEGVIETAMAGTNAIFSGSLSGPGRTQLRHKARGGYAAVKLINAVSSETWALEKIMARGGEAGRIK